LAAIHNRRQVATFDHHLVAGSGLNQALGDAVVKDRVEPQQGVQPRQVRDEIGLGAPVEARSPVNIDFFGGEPLDPVGKGEPPLVGAQGAQRRTHPGKFVGAGRQAVVVMGLGKMDQRSFAFGDLEGRGQVILDLPPVIVLKEFGIGPVEIGLVQQGAGHRNFAAETLKKEQGVGKLLAHRGDDVAPGFQWNHVARVAAKTVHPAAAPGHKDLGHVMPQVATLVVQASQVGPDHPPGPRIFDPSLPVAHQPFGVFVVQAGGPSGVVDGDIQNQFAFPGVDGVDQFEELLHGCGRRVEDRQGRVYSGKTQRRVRAAKTSHAGIGRGNPMDRQQLNQSAAEPIEDEIQVGDQIAKGPRWRDHRVAAAVQGGDGLRVARAAAAIAVGTELAHKGVVNDVGAARVRRFDLDGHVVSGGPERLIGAGGQEETLGAKLADFHQRQPCLESSVVDAPHGHVIPVMAGKGSVGFNRGDDFAPPDRGVADVGPDPGRPRHLLGQGEGQGEHIAGKTDQPAAGGRILNQGIQMGHGATGSGFKVAGCGLRRRHAPVSTKGQSTVPRMTGGRVPSLKKSDHRRRPNRSESRLERGPGW
jgi:hypothetical protein